MSLKKQADENKGVATADYDFARCKLCGAIAASPKYLLKKTTVYACAACDFHCIDHLDRLPPKSPPLDRRAWDYIEGRLPASEKQLRKDLLLVQSHVALSGLHCLDIGAGAGAGAFTHRQLLDLTGRIGFTVIRTHSSVFPTHNKLVLVCRKP